MGLSKSAFGSDGAKPAPAPAPVPLDPIDVLRRVEWLGIAGGWASCPLCGYAQTVGHAPDCDLAAVLRAHPSTTLAPDPPRG